MGERVNINPKYVLIALAALIGLPIAIFFFVKRPYLLVAVLVVGAIILLPVLEKKLGF